MKVILVESNPKGETFLSDLFAQYLAEKAKAISHVFPNTDSTTEQKQTYKCGCSKVITLDCEGKL